MSWQNLDLDCAVAAGKIIEDVLKTQAVSKQDFEAAVNSAFTTLADHGPYAVFLYLRSREDKKDGPFYCALKQQLYSQIKAILEGTSAESPPPAETTGILTKVAEWGADFNRLLLMRKVLMQILTYLRYHAKALAQAPEKTKAASA